MAGYWLKPDTGECVRVATTHDAWIRDRTNAEGLGLPDAAYLEIMQYPPTAIDEIRLVAVRHGLVRIREHRRHVSVQYMSEAGVVKSVLQAVMKALSGVGIHPDTWLQIDNLLLRETDSMTLNGLREKMEDGEESGRDLSQS